jgi:steroid 5-alpha reductase family enzyme
MVCLILVFNAYINILLYKEYTKEEDESVVKFFNKFDKKSFFVNNFINVFAVVNILLIILIVVINLI